MAGKATVLAMLFVAALHFTAAVPINDELPIKIECLIPGQVYLECGSACPPTCDDLNPLCPLVCSRGCQCPFGTVLHENQCIQAKDCPVVEPPTQPSCPIIGQVFTPCGSACPPTCENLNPICTKQCVPGCQCPAGTVLKGNRCVKPKFCLSIRPPYIYCPLVGQVFNPCGTACPPTCEVPNPICTKQCAPGCQCPSGTVLDDDRCIPLKSCSIQQLSLD